MKTQEDMSRRLPLLERADPTAILLTIITIVVLGALFFLGKTRFPFIDTAFEWLWYVLGSLLVLLEVAYLVHDFRRRRRKHPPMPSAPKPQSATEKTARAILTDLLLDHPNEVEHGRMHGDLYERLKDEIDSAASQFFLLCGESGPASDEFHRQLVRILGGGDERCLQGYSLHRFEF